MPKVQIAGSIVKVVTYSVELGKKRAIHWVAREKNGRSDIADQLGG